MTTDIASAQAMFNEAVKSKSQTETIIEQSKFKALQGLWAIRSDFEQPEDDAVDFFLGGLLGMAMMAAKLQYEEQRRQAPISYYEEEFLIPDENGNLVDPMSPEANGF